MHDKPKVTIDLAEYNGLLEKANIKPDDKLSAAKEAIATLINSCGNLIGAHQQLLSNNIKLEILDRSRYHAKALNGDDVDVIKTK